MLLSGDIINHNHDNIHIHHNAIEKKVFIYLDLALKTNRRVAHICCVNKQLKFFGVTYKSRHLFTNRYENLFQHIKLMTNTPLRKQLETYLTILTKQCVLSHIMQCLSSYKKFYNVSEEDYNNFSFLQSTIESFSHSTRQESMIKCAFMYDEFQKIAPSFKTISMQTEIKHNLYLLNGIISHAIMAEANVLQEKSSKFSASLYTYMMSNHIDIITRKCLNCNCEDRGFDYPGCGHVMCTMCTYKSLLKYDNCICCQQIMQISQQFSQQSQSDNEDNQNQSGAEEAENQSGAEEAGAEEAEEQSGAEEAEEQSDAEENQPDAEDAEKPDEEQSEPNEKPTATIKPATRTYANTPEDSQPPQQKPTPAPAPEPELIPAPALEPEPIPAPALEPEPIPAPALEPESIPAPALEPESIPAPALEPETATIKPATRTYANTPEPAPAPEPEPIPAPALEPEPIPAPALEPEPIPAPALEPESIPAPALEPESIPAPALEPESIPAPALEPESIPAPALEPEPIPAPALEPEPIPAPALEPELTSELALPPELALPAELAPFQLEAIPQLPINNYYENITPVHESELSAMSQFVQSVQLMQQSLRVISPQTINSNQMFNTVVHEDQQSSAAIPTRTVIYSMTCNNDDLRELNLTARGKVYVPTDLVLDIVKEEPVIEESEQTTEEYFETSTTETTTATTETTTATAAQAPTTPDSDDDDVIIVGPIHCGSFIPKQAKMDKKKCEE
uniref:HOAR n=1 Tax=Chrysodeixis includens nucleopolyhedrovirus TaxID=1207438 RepID=A0A6B9CFR3_9ABAC|nr:HOAR [Chrysodeixis includens nucleopolyhedrovirus]